MVKRQEKIVVRNDDDAWLLLSTWLSGEDISQVEFIGWPVLGIHIKGDDYHSSLNSGQMLALVDLRIVMGRALSLISHGSYDMRYLHSDQEEQLQFVTRVKRGSSILDTDFAPIINAFSSAVSSHPALSIAAATTIGLALVARPVIVKYYEHRAKELEVEERKRIVNLALSRSEEERYNIFESSIEHLQHHYPQFSQIVPNARESFWKFVSASVDADRVEIAGLQLTQDDIELLAERRRRRASNIRSVDAVFRITAIRRSGAFFKVGLQSKNLTFSATYRKPQLTNARLKKLMKCFADGSAISATVEVREVDKAQVIGRLVSFKLAEW